MKTKIAISCLSLLAGCASIPEGAGLLPVCDKFSVYQVESQQYGPGFFIDVENAIILANLIRGISERKCRLDADNAAKTPVI